jgi:xanthine dehydrogenase accessory factor
VGQIADELRRWQERGDAHAALATVVATRRSAPRPVGSRLAVSEQGELAGSVSGGCVESEVAELAKEVLATGEARVVSYGISDELAFSVGLPCGGEIDVSLERVPLDDLEALAAETSPHRLVVFGAVDIAEALCAAANQLGWQSVVADPRPAFATPERVPSAGEVRAGWPDEVLAEIEPDEATAVVVLTHENRFDVPALAVALRSEAFYVGALGSRRTTERRRERLLEVGVAEEQLDRIMGPCGLDIGADSQEETALAIIAEILAVRAGRRGGPLRDSKQRIHVEV